MSASHLAPSHIFCNWRVAMRKGYKHAGMRCPFAAGVVAEVVGDTRRLLHAIDGLSVRLRV